MIQAGHPLTLIVVEDDALLCADMIQTFKDAGMLAFAAGNARDALDLLDTLPGAQVVVTDVHLGPGEATGLHLIKVLRERENEPDLLVLSGEPLPSGSLPENARYLHKPCDPRSPVGAVFALLEDRNHRTS